MTEELSEEDQEIADWLDSLSDEEYECFDELTANILKQAVDSLHTEE